MNQSQKFHRLLLHPRYWLTWFGVSVLFLLVQLPYPLLYTLGNWVGGSLLVGGIYWLIYRRPKRLAK